MIEPSVIERVKEISESAIAKRGFEFVHLELAGSKRSPIIRVFVDKPGGITIDDCGDVSRDIESVLDLDDIVPSKYVLEVSSPGIERGLFKKEDYVRFTGSEVKITLSEAIDGQKTFVGTIEKILDDGVVISDRKNGLVELGFTKIHKANLKIDLDKEFQR